MSDEEDVKLRPNGEVDGRGRSEGSRQGQFKAGDGRPRPGRRKGSRDTRTIIEAIRDAPVNVTDAKGRRTKRTTREGIFMALRQKALSGDLKAAQYLLSRFEQYELPPAELVRTSDLLADDEIIRAAVLRGILLEDATNVEEEE